MFYVSLVCLLDFFNFYFKTHPQSGAPSLNLDQRLKAGSHIAVINFQMPLQTGLKAIL